MIYEYEAVIYACDEDDSARLCAVVNPSYVTDLRWSADSLEQAAKRLGLKREERAGWGGAYAIYLAATAEQAAAFNEITSPDFAMAPATTREVLLYLLDGGMTALVNRGAEADVPVSVSHDALDDYLVDHNIYADDVAAGVLSSRMSEAQAVDFAARFGVMPRAIEPGTSLWIDEETVQPLKQAA